jgi:SAM-dependent methyltransferase
MKINECLGYLKHPDSEQGTEFFISEDHLIDKRTNKKYPIIHNMIDFQGGVISHPSRTKKGFLFRLNTLYSEYLDTRIRVSIFTAGGVGFIKAANKMKQWVDQYAEDRTLFLEPEDSYLISYLGRDKCLTVEDITSKNVLPLEADFPNLNASLEQLPIRTASFQNVISKFILEHVKDPRQHMREITRIVKPGGYIILGGPGDIYPSHRTPYNFFNVIRYGYLEMFKENGLELVEEYFPAKSWMSILYIIYSTTVRNSWFNRNQFTKLSQMVVLGISLLLSPIMNALALVLDLITPFDQRGYSVYLALLRKPVI